LLAIIHFGKAIKSGYCLLHDILFVFQARISIFHQLLLVDIRNIPLLANVKVSFVSFFKFSPTSVKDLE